MQWLYHNQPVTDIPDEYIGFVYKITNNQSGRAYIGKKLAKFSKTRYKMHLQKNGRKVRKKIRELVASDWPTYWGSSDALLKDIALLGEQNFTREILQFCHTKSQCNYLEAKLQFQWAVLESDQWYNNQIMCRIHGKSVKNQP